MLFKVLKKQKYSWTLGVQSSINSLCGVLKWSELSSCDWNRGHTLSTATRQVRMLSNPKAEAVPQTHGLYLDTVFLWVADNNVVSEAAILNGVWACSWQEAGTVRVLWCHSFYHLILSAGAHSIGSTAFLTNRKNCTYSFANSNGRDSSCTASLNQNITENLASKLTPNLFPFPL